VSRRASRRGLLPLAGYSLLGLLLWQCGQGRKADEGSDDVHRAGASSTAGGASGGDAGADTSGAAGAVPLNDGDTCEAPELLHVPRSDQTTSLSVVGTTLGMRDDARGTLGGCAGSGSGADHFWSLDLSEFTERVRLQVILDADFDALLTLDKGSCEDPAPIECDRATVAGRRVSTWTTELDPGAYRLIVDGAGPSDNGAYRLTAVVSPLPARCSAPSNSACSAAVPLSFETDSSSVFVDRHCAEAGDARPALYYLLDLTRESGFVGVNAAVYPAEIGSDVIEADEDAYAFPAIRSLDSDSDCGSSYASYGFAHAHGDTISVALEPGVYLVELSGPPRVPSLLTVRLTRPDCSGEQHDTCADAENIVLDRGYALLRGHTFCNTDRFTHERCSWYEDTPDRFYRLDLSDREGRSHLRAALTARDLDFYAALVLLREEQDGCSAPVQCYDALGNFEGWPVLDMVLEPDVYIIAIEAMPERAAGNYVLDVEVSEPDPEAFRACYDADIDECVWYTSDIAGECCTNPFAPECGTRYVSCGLDPSVQDCICRTDARCCDGTAEDIERCAPAFSTCGFFCGDEPAFVFGCLDSTILRGPALE
jgi:hypothetical protein